MYVNKDSVVVNIRGIDMIMNLNNGAVVGVDNRGIQLYHKMVNESIRYNEILDPEMKELYQFLHDNGYFHNEKTTNAKTSLVSAYVHLTNKCNLHCIGCYSLDSKRNKEQDLSDEVFRKAIRELAEEGVTNLIFSGGEPLLYKNIVELIKYAKVDCNIETVVLITNGTVKRPEVFDGIKEYIDMVSVSIDTYSSQCEAYIRDKGIHDKVVGTVKAMRNYGIPVSILPTLHKLNAKNMIKYLELSKEMGVGISYSILSTCETEEFKRFMLTEAELLSISDHFLNYGLVANDTPINNTLESKNYCGACKNMLSIGTDGKVYPCHMLMEPEFCLGDINNSSLQEIREKSEVAKTFNEYNVDEFNECNVCSYKYLCGGGCRARAFMLKQNLKEKDPYCVLYKNYYDHLIDNISTRVVAQNTLV